MVRYRVKDKKVPDVIKAIKEFVENVRKSESGTLKYEVYQLVDDQREFVHFMSFRDKSSEDRHRDTKHVKKFVDILYPLCKKGPKFIGLKSTL